MVIKSEMGENFISTPDPPKSMVQSQPLKSQPPKLLKLKITYIKNRLVVAKEERVGGRTGWEIGVNRCKLLHRINNKVLLYSTENHNQYPMINHNGKAKNSKER